MNNLRRYFPKYMEIYHVAESHGAVVLGLEQDVLWHDNLRFDLNSRPLTIQLTFQEIQILGPAGYEILINKLHDAINKKGR